MANSSQRWAAAMLALLGLCNPVSAAETSPAAAADISSLSTPTPTTLLTATLTTSTTSASHPVTVAPIYLPYYDQHAWSAVRGSIIGSDDAANKTTYTIFCPQSSAEACNLALNFPFVVVEGPKTVEFHGTYTSTLIIDIECKLDSKQPAATCSGYSSLKSGYSMGLATGPTEGTWTSTFVGTDADWSNLTLSTVPTQTDGSSDSGGDQTAGPGLTSTALLYIPEESGQSDSSRYSANTKWTAAALALSLSMLLL